MNFSEMWESLADEDGFYDIACKKCGGTDFIVQANLDGVTLRIICFSCKSEHCFHVEKYVEPFKNNGVNHR